MNTRLLITLTVLGAIGGLASGCSGLTDPGCSPLESNGAHAICLIDGKGSTATIGPYHLTARASDAQCACPGGSWPPGVGVSLELEKIPIDTSDKNWWSCIDVRLYAAQTGGTHVYSRNTSLGLACEASGVGGSGGPSGTHEGGGWITELRDDDVGAHVSAGVYYARILITWLDGTATEMPVGVIRRV